MRVNIAPLLLLYTQLVAGYGLDLDDPSSIKYVASRVAYKMMQFYPGNKTGETPGKFGDPYYWWEAGAVFGALIDYWYYTGDASYNNVTTQAMLWQVGPNKNYMPLNETADLGNDDQAFWALAAMAAAEKNFPNPEPDQPQWLALAQAVFDSQAARWDMETCGGGLRWQIFTLNAGYNYKNGISNGCFFHLAARLARYTSNDTYLEWAETAWNWTQAIGLISNDYKVYDGFDVSNCSKIQQIEWTYNAGMYLAGAAFLYNHTGGHEIWRQRIDGILNQTDVFFFNEILLEISCEPYSTCNTDQQSFKAYLARCMALCVQLAPWTASYIIPKLRTSAVAAASHCSYGVDNNTCALRWWTPDYDGWYGVGEQMSALETIQSNLINRVAPPATHKDRGNSMGTPHINGTGLASGIAAPTRRERDSAAALTTFSVLGSLMFFWWLVV